jgi:hypothetical protein
MTHVQRSANMKSFLPALAAVATMLFFSAPAESGELIRGRIFVSSSGNDANNCVQAGSSAGIIDPSVKPRRTITHACALAKPNMHIEIFTGEYFENVVCNASGTGPRAAVTIHDAAVAGPGPVTITSAPGSTAPVFELTGSWINFGGFHVESGKGDGTDAAHPATGVQIPEGGTWAAIKDQFGPDYGRMDNFKPKFRLALRDRACRLSGCPLRPRRQRNNPSSQLTANPAPPPHFRRLNSPFIPSSKTEPLRANCSKPSGYQYLSTSTWQGKPRALGRNDSENPRALGRNDSENPRALGRTNL